MPQWDAACRVPEWEALVYGPVLPDPVLLPHPRPKERHCCKSCHWENTTHSHYYCAQLPGSLHFTAFRLLLALITSGAVAQKHCVWDLISPICLLSTVLHFGCVQQWWHPAYGRPAVHAAGEDLEFIFADEQGANRHPYITAPQHLGKSLQQPDQGWEKQILLAFFF